jgi:beta-mannanase
MLFSSWSQKLDFPSKTVSDANAAGMATMISWQPWSPKKGKVAQPSYAPAAVAAGKFDAYITSWAKSAAQLKFPIYMRFAHEMNGPWYPWGFGVKGNTAAQYVKAWKRIHNIFVANKATNVVWVWAPNTVSSKSKVSLQSYYPGAKYVDVIGPVGYVRKTGDTFNSVFKLTLDTVKKFSSKPVLISETGCFTKVKSQAKCITEFFETMSKNKSIMGFVWFNSTSKRSNWHLSGSKSIAAYRKGLAKYFATRSAKP